MTEFERLTIRLEALKLAYKTAYEIGIFSKASIYDKSQGKYIEEDLEDVHRLADMNLQYLMEPEEDMREPF